MVRIIAPDANAISAGSGTLVAVTPSHGLVVTNWHVIRDATGKIWVLFPDGFRSAATVLRTDRDWDLAALAIGRPAAQPVSIAAGAPQLDEPLTIAGYGGGSYRAVSGRCVGYAAPNVNFPHEFVQLSVTARSGDSGGPIFNRRGELAGVLFGADFLETTGAYSGRVRAFLTPCLADLQRLTPESALLAQATPPALAPPQLAPSDSPPSSTPGGSRLFPGEPPPAILPTQRWAAAVPAAPIRSQPVAPETGLDVPSDPLAATWPSGPDDPRLSPSRNAPRGLAPIQRRPSQALSPTATSAEPVKPTSSRGAIATGPPANGPAMSPGSLPQPAGSIPVAIGSDGMASIQSEPTTTPWEFGRNGFALVGVLAVFLQVLRMLNPGPAARSR